MARLKNFAASPNIALQILQSNQRVFILSPQGYWQKSEDRNCISCRITTHRRNHETGSRLDLYLENHKIFSWMLYTNLITKLGSSDHTHKVLGDRLETMLQRPKQKKYDTSERAIMILMNKHYSLMRCDLNVEASSESLCQKLDLTLLGIFQWWLQYTAAFTLSHWFKWWLRRVDNFWVGTECQRNEW